MYLIFKACPHYIEQDRIWITWSWIQSGFDPVRIFLIARCETRVHAAQLKRFLIKYYLHSVLVMFFIFVLHCCHVRWYPCFAMEEVIFSNIALFLATPSTLLHSDDLASVSSRILPPEICCHMPQRSTLLHWTRRSM